LLPSLAKEGKSYDKLNMETPSVSAFDIVNFDKKYCNSQDPNSRRLSHINSTRFCWEGVSFYWRSFN